MAGGAAGAGAAAAAGQLLDQATMLQVMTGGGTPTQQAALQQMIVMANQHQLPPETSQMLVNTYNQAQQLMQQQQGMAAGGGAAAAAGAVGPGAAGLRAAQQQAAPQQAAAPPPTGTDLGSQLTTQGAALIGQRVWRYWPDEGGWYEAEVLDWKPATGEHVLIYERGTMDESTEDCRFAEMDETEVRVQPPPGWGVGALGDRNFTADAEAEEARRISAEDALAGTGASKFSDLLGEL
jgi:hypothetical protein